jgi:hypothetical protein
MSPGANVASRQRKLLTAPLIGEPIANVRHEWHPVLTGDSFGQRDQFLAALKDEWTGDTPLHAADKARIHLDAPSDRGPIDLLQTHDVGRPRSSQRETADIDVTNDPRFGLGSNMGVKDANGGHTGRARIDHRGDAPSAAHLVGIAAVEADAWGRGARGHLRV